MRTTPLALRMATASLLVALSPIVAAQTLPVWVRPAASAAQAAGDPKPLFVIDLDALSLRITRRFDAQYGKAIELLGMPIGALLDRAEIPRSVDLALLHFGRGMIVPLRFRDEDAMRRLEPWVARSGRVPGSLSFMQGNFPALPARANTTAIVLGGNKVVVAVPTDGAQRPRFSPWQWVDSLVGIELVESNAYFAQFDVAPDDEGAHRGFATFKETCSHCHGLRGVGAAYGPDFVEPTPVYLRFSREEPATSATPSPTRSLQPNPYLPRKQIESMRRESDRTQGSSDAFQRWRRSLYAHVKFGRLGPKRAGAAMPQLPFISEQEASGLWDWLRAVAKTPPPRYTPRDVEEGGSPRTPVTSPSPGN